MPQTNNMSGFGSGIATPFVRSEGVADTVVSKNEVVFAARAQHRALHVCLYFMFCREFLNNAVRLSRLWVIASVSEVRAYVPFAKRKGMRTSEATLAVDARSP